MKLSAACFITHAVLGVVSQQHLYEITVSVNLTADAQVERRQSVRVDAVHRSTEIQQSLAQRTPVIIILGIYIRGWKFSLVNSKSPRKSGSLKIWTVDSHENHLTLSPPTPLRLYTLPYWSNAPFLIFGIRALWRSGLSARAPKCQKLKMVG